MMNRKVKLPVLDIRQFYVFPQLFVDNLRSAVRADSMSGGFFLLRHDIHKTSKRNLALQQIQEARHFFLHSYPRKQSIGVENHRTFRGYYDFHYESMDAAETMTRYYCEHLRLGALYSYRQFGAAWPAYEQLKGVNPSTRFQPSFQYIYDQYSIEMRRIAEHLREAFTMALDLPRSEFVHFIKPKPHWFLNLSKYHPSSSGSSTDSADQRSCGSLKQSVDINLFTLTLQDGWAAGLQLRPTSSNDGEQETWLDVGKIRPEFLICNVGQQLEALSNGHFRSNPYRVTVTTGLRSLLAISFEYNPSLETSIDPLPSQQSNPTAPKPQISSHHTIQPIQVGDFLFKNLAKMHPDAFCRFYPDLEILEDGRILQKNDKPPEDIALKIKMV